MVVCEAPEKADDHEAGVVGMDSVYVAPISALRGI